MRKRKDVIEKELLLKKNGIIDDEFIIFKFYNKSAMNAKPLEENNITEEEREYLLNRYDDCNNLVEAVYRIKNNISDHPKCPICGKPALFIRRSYNEYCSKQCANKNPQLINKRKKTCLSKFGTEVPAKNKDIAKKISETYSLRTEEEREATKLKTQQTCLERYGVTNHMKLNEYKEKFKLLVESRTEEEREATKLKTQQTCLERYGVPNINCLDSRKEKLREIAKNRTSEKNKQIGLKISESYNRKTEEEREAIRKKHKMSMSLRTEEEREATKLKTQQTCLERYGVKSHVQSEDFKNKMKTISSEKSKKASETILKRYGTYINLEKAKNTNLERYGYKSYSKTDEFKKLMSATASSEEFQRKRTETLKRNNTFISSKQEEFAYNMLCEKFNDVKRQYKSKEYPYVCDFYIPSINTYIEYHGSQYHHGHAFDINNEEDIIELNRLYNKSNELHINKKTTKRNMYDVIIYVWTKLDPKKKYIAEENKLNWYAFYNIQECEDWLKNININSIL